MLGIVTLEALNMGRLDYFVSIATKGPDFDSQCRPAALLRTVIFKALKITPSFELGNI